MTTVMPCLDEQSVKDFVAVLVPAIGCAGDCIGCCREKAFD